MDDTTKDFSNPVALVGSAVDDSVSVLTPLAPNVQSPEVIAENARNEALGASNDYHKRLRVIRPRSARDYYSTRGKSLKYFSDRGPITMMRLLKNPDYDIKADGIPSDLEADINALLSKEGFVNFFVTNFDTSFSEKTQVFTTFGDGEVIYYFGKQPVVFNITGMLFDSIDNDWFSKFLRLYQHVLRGSQLAKNFNLIQLTLPNMIITGTISQLNVRQDATRDTDISFGMQFIAKEVLPIPISLNEGPPPGNISANLINFKANRSGVTVLGLSSQTLGSGFLNPGIEFLRKTTSAANANNEALNTFRASMFSPVFGIITSITKVVKTTTGDVSEIISSFTDPVNQVLRDITNIATQASGLALLVQSSILQATSAPGQSIINFKNTLAALKGSAGIISRLPQNIADNFRSYNSGGYVPAQSTLVTAGKAGSKSKASVLSSGKPYNPTKSNVL
jgi:hypothetical protein